MRIHAMAIRAAEGSGDHGEAFKRLADEIEREMRLAKGIVGALRTPKMLAGFMYVALFLATYPELGALNVMKLASPQSAILSAVIFNALIIVALIPLALKGVAYRPVGAAALLRRNLLIYGLGGLVAPFIGIKLIDLAVASLHLV